MLVRGPTLEARPDEGSDPTMPPGHASKAYSAAGSCDPDGKVDTADIFGVVDTFRELYADGCGPSNYDFRRLVTHALNMLTGFSAFPLRIASLTGFAFTLFGFAVLVYVIGRYLIEGTPVAGFPFLASLIAIFSGAQLFALGIMGEYLARIHSRTLDRPAYSIRSESSEDECR